MKTAVVVSMSCESHRSVVKGVYIIPMVDTYEEAYQKASEKFKLSGDWSEEVGISFITTDTDAPLNINLHAGNHEAYFHNGERKK